jgi:hypothetical protein
LAFIGVAAPAYAGQPLETETARLPAQGEPVVYTSIGAESRSDAFQWQAKLGWARAGGGRGEVRRHDPLLKMRGRTLIRKRLVRHAFVSILVLAAAGCSRPTAPPERVPPDEMENFISAQQAALNRAEADEAAENAAEARNEINQPAGTHGVAKGE